MVSGAYILIIIAWMNHLTATTQEFSSRLACENAAAVTNRVMAGWGMTGSHLLRAFCVPKDLPEKKP